MLQANGSPEDMLEICGGNLGYHISGRGTMAFSEQGLGYCIFDKRTLSLPIRTCQSLYLYIKLARIWFHFTYKYRYFLHSANVNEFSRKSDCCVNQGKGILCFAQNFRSYSSFRKITHLQQWHCCYMSHQSSSTALIHIWAAPLR